MPGSHILYPDMETSTWFMTPKPQTHDPQLAAFCWPPSLPGSSESLYQPHWRLVKPMCSPVTELSDWRSQCSVDRDFSGEAPLFCNCTPGQPGLCGSELGQAFLPTLYLGERKKQAGIQRRDEWDRISQNDTIYNIQFKKGLSLFLRSWRKTNRLLTVPIPSHPLKQQCDEMLTVTLLFTAFVRCLI